MLLGGVRLVVHIAVTITTIGYTKEKERKSEDLPKLLNRL